MAENEPGTLAWTLPRAQAGPPSISPILEHIAADSLADLCCLWDLHTRACHGLAVVAQRDPVEETFAGHQPCDRVGQRLLRVVGLHAP